MPRSIILSLIVISAGGGILARSLEWTPKVTAADIPPAPVIRVGMPPPNEAHATDTANLQQRPLFTPGRRAYAPMAAAESPTPVETAGPDPVPTVLGIATSGDQAVAIVGEADGARPRGMVLGDSIKGWRVVAIERGSVTFRSATDEAVAYLRKPDTQAPPTAAPRAEGTAVAERPVSLATCRNPEQAC